MFRYKITHGNMQTIIKMGSNECWKRVEEVCDTSFELKGAYICLVCLYRYGEKTRDDSVLRDSQFHILGKFKQLRTCPTKGSSFFATLPPVFLFRSLSIRWNWKLSMNTSELEMHGLHHGDETSVNLGQVIRHFREKNFTHQ